MAELEFDSGVMTPDIVSQFVIEHRVPNWRIFESS